MVLRCILPTWLVLLNLSLLGVCEIFDRDLVEEANEDEEQDGDDDAFYEDAGEEADGDEDEDSDVDLELLAQQLADLAEDEESDPVVDDLFAWATVHGATGLDNFRTKSFPKGHDAQMIRGLTLKSPAKEGDEILVLPPAIQLHSRSSATKAAYRSAMDKLGLPSQVLEGFPEPLTPFVAGLLALRESGDPDWLEYINCLPTLEDFSSFHLATARPDLLETFAKLPLVTRTFAANARWDRRFHGFKELGANTSHKDWKWAEMIARTRAWGVSDPFRGASMMLAPVVDLLNFGHEEEQNVHVEVNPHDENNPVIMTATRDIEPGEELLTYYGEANDDKTALSWGFIHPETKSKSPVAALDSDSCAALAEPLSRAISADGSCKAPEDEAQKGIFCILVQVAATQCQVDDRVAEHKEEL